jgi:ABC-type multidrug transport system fused ATPase/permease subunit
MSIYRRVLAYYQPFLPHTILGLLLSFAGIGLNLLKPWPFKIIVDDVIPVFLSEQMFISRLMNLGGIRIRKRWF